MPFQLITEEHLKKLDACISDFIKENDIKLFADNLSCLIDNIRNDIPKEKRISTGRYSVIKETGNILYDRLTVENIPVFDTAVSIFRNIDIDYLVRGIAIQLITICGLEDLDKTWPYIIQAASSDHWEMREFIAGFVHKLIEKYPEEIKSRYLKILNESDNEFLRRFVPESMRPVKENKWFVKNPEYQLSVLRKMFGEKYPYSRTSVGNNLSDWARTYPEMVYEIAGELVKSGDKNSYWIAYRACRNLVKKEPLRVMDLLGVDEYKYKTRIHYRKDYI